MANGRKRDIYKSWDDCNQQVHGYSGAKFKRFKSMNEANSFVQSHQAPNSPSESPSNSSSSKSSYSGSSSCLSNSHPSKSNYSSDSYHSSNKPIELSHTRYLSNSRQSCPSVPSYFVETVGSPPSSEPVRVYVDGACRGNGKSSSPTPLSGYGVYYGKNDSKNVAASLTEVDDITVNRPSNQRAELHAIHHALKNIDSSADDGKSYEICTDSQYSKNCIEKWFKIWEKNDFKTTLGSQALNIDIIVQAHKLFTKLNKEDPDKVKLVYVKGHLGEPGNEAADRLANKGADKMKSALANLREEE